MLCENDLARFHTELWLSDTKARQLENPVKQLMRDEVEYHIDPITGEVNATALAETAANHFDLYEYGSFATPQDIYDWAAELAFELEAHYH